MHTHSFTSNDFLHSLTFASLKKKMHYEGFALSQQTSSSLIHHFLARGLQLWISDRQHDNICESLQSSIKRARTFSCIKITILDGKGSQQQAISCVRGSCMRCKLLWTIILASQWDVCLNLYCCDDRVLLLQYSRSWRSCSIRRSYISEALQAHTHKQPFRS